MSLGIGSSAGDRFAGRRVLVTGASGGIGGAVALGFARQGAMVTATGRREDKLRALAAELDGRIRFLAGDVTDARFLADLLTQAGAVDVLVNGAGILKHAPLLDTRPEDWERVFAVNVLSVLRLTQAVARGMVERRDGHIINISSVLAREVRPNTMVYAATKHAIRAISKGLRKELFPFGIRVTEIAPGLVRTEILREIDHPEVLDTYRRMTFAPLEPQDIADAILGAAAAEARACPELIEIMPTGQA